MTVEEAQAALEQAQAAYDAAKGTGVSNVVAASKALSAARRALATAQKAEAAGVNVADIPRTQQLATIRQAQYTAAQEEAGRGEKPTPPPADEDYTYDYSWRSEVGGTGGYWSLVRYPKAPTVPVSTTSTTTKPVTTTPNTTVITTTPVTTVVSTTPVTTTPATTVITTTPATSNIMTAGQQDIYSIIVDRLNRYNLGSLAPLIKKLAIEGATEATIMLRLQDEPLYQERFKANQARIQKGLKVLSPSEYLTLEDDYRQVLRAYGLTQFDNDAYVSQFLANDISVSELSNRVVAAVQRVRNADPAVSSMLKNYYGIGQNDLVAYVLDPSQQFQKIERQIAASEVGVAAARQGFNIGVPVAEQLAAQGITQAEAQRGYATIADILPTAQKLSDIYGNTLEGYGLAEGEQEVFNQLASAQRKRQRLTQREVAEFSGTSGTGRTSLAGQVGGQF